jgi:hypothetical protein
LAVAAGIDQDEPIAVADPRGVSGIAPAFSGAGEPVVEDQRLARSLDLIVNTEIVVHEVGHRLRPF